MTGGLRIGIDVGGTFTKAVAIEARHARAPRERHGADDARGSRGSRERHRSGARRPARAAGDDRARVEFVAFSTTQAMNALLEGDVARVGVIGLADAHELRLARKRTKVGSIELAAGRSLETEHEALDTMRLTATSTRRSNGWPAPGARRSP